MYLAVLSLGAGPEIADQTLDPELLVDVLWAIADPADRIDHISTLSGPGRANVGCYLRADTQSDAERRARTLLERATATAPLLRGWHVQPPPAAGDPAHDREHPP